MHSNSEANQIKIMKRLHLTQINRTLHIFKILIIIFMFLLFLLPLSSMYAWDRYISFESNNINCETTPKRIVKKINDTEMDISYRFPGATVSELKEEGTLYELLNIDGFANLSDIGAPALPVHNEIVAMPKGASGKITILEVKSKEFDKFTIPPTLEPASDSYGAPPPKFIKNFKIYTANKFYPKEIVKIASIGISRGTLLAYVQIRPIAYNPVTKKIRVYYLIRFRISFKNTDDNFSYISKENSLHYTGLLKRNIINSTSISTSE